MPRCPVLWDVSVACMHNVLVASISDRNRLEILLSIIRDADCIEC